MVECEKGKGVFFRSFKNEEGSRPSGVNAYKKCAYGDALQRNKKKGGQQYKVDREGCRSPLVYMKSPAELRKGKKKLTTNERK